MSTDVVPGWQISVRGKRNASQAAGEDAVVNEAALGNGGPDGHFQEFLVQPPGRHGGNSKLAPQIAQIRKDARDTSPHSSEDQRGVRVEIPHQMKMFAG